MENQNREYKEMWKDEYIKTVAAFANSDGGELIIGINDKGNIVGVPNAERLMEDLPNKIRSKLLITPFVTLSEKEKKKIISIKVENADFPVFFESRLYIRSGSTTQELTGAELNSFLITKSGKSWDSIETEATISELDEETINTFIQFSKQRLPFIENTNVETLLQNLELIKNGKLTRAALLLFGKKPQSYFLSAYIRCGRFKDAITIFDSKEYYGNLFKQLEDAMNFIKNHTSVRYEIKVNNLSLHDLTRKDIWEYPLDAIREAIINAIIHRDYNDYSSCVEVRIYDDKIWINNAGKLPSPLTVDDLKLPNHQSKPKNPLLAKVFYFAGLIERWGTGTHKMIQLCKNAGLPEPKFENRQEGIGSFTVIFNKDMYTEEQLRKMGLNERQIRAVLYVKEKGKISNKEYRNFYNISDEMARLELSGLVNKNIFAIQGKGRNVHYVLK